MRKLSLAIIMLAVSFGSALAQTPDAKAAEIIKQARAAIGKEDKFKAIQTLSAEGLIRQATGPNGSQENTLEIEMMMPDKLKMTTTMQFGQIIRAFDGNGTWNDFIPAVGMGGGPGGGMVRMMGGGQGGPGGQQNSTMATYMQQQQRREFNQIFLAWFLAPPPNAQMTYAFVGEAPGPEGAKLNVIDAKTGDGVVTRLYFNQETNRLIGLSYKAKSMRFGRGPGGPGGQQRPAADGGQRQGGQAPAQGAQGGQPGQGGQRQQMTPEEMERRMKERMEQFEKSPEIDFRWQFDDYRNVNGLNLPHRLSKSENNTPTEEWEISKYKANNNKITADKFVKKDKPANP